MAEGKHEQEEYLEPDEAEVEAAQRNKKLIVLAIMAALVLGGIFLVNKLRTASQLQDCLMTRATNCNDMVEPPKPISNR